MEATSSRQNAGEIDSLGGALDSIQPSLNAGVVVVSAFSSFVALLPARINVGSQASAIFANLAAGLVASIGTYIQSAFSVPSIPTSAGIDFGSIRPTRSPFWQPHSLSIRARRLPASSNAP